MAWCPSCEQDRQITRQTYDGACPYCGQGRRVTGATSRPVEIPHSTWCRAPLIGALNVCTFCHEPLFAKAATEDAYRAAESLEAEQQAANRATANQIDERAMRERNLEIMVAGVVMAGLVIAVVLFVLWNVLKS